MKFLKGNWLLAAILVLAIALRFYKLGTIPIGFNDDEAAFGYNAYSILTSGRDEWGRLLPFPVFESFGDWKLVGYLYPVVISQFFFGTNEFATRFPSALFGVLAVWATYLLAKKLFENSNWKFEIGNLKLEIAHISALLLAISPWHIVASRNAFESDPQIFFLTLGTYFFLKSLKNKNYLFLTALLFGISLYTYRSSWLFVPLFASTLIFFFKDEIKFKIRQAKIIILALAIVLPLVPTGLSFRGQSRFQKESFLSGIAKTGIIDDVNTRRGTCLASWPRLFCAATYNQYLFYFSTFVNNYISNLSPETYFVRGNPGGYQSFSIRSLLFTFELPLLILGIILLILKRHQAIKILIPWLLIVPIGPSITGVGNPGRLNIILPSVQIIAAAGLVSLLSFFKNDSVKKLLAFIAFVIIGSSAVRFIADLFVYYPRVSGSFQRYGYKELFGYLATQKDNYNQIAISRQTDDAKQYIHYLFFAKVNPQIFNDPKFTAKYRGEDGWQVVEKIDKLHFYPQTPKIVDLPPKTLLATGVNEVSFRQDPMFVVKYLNGDVAFEVYDVDQVKEKEGI